MGALGQGLAGLGDLANQIGTAQQSVKADRLNDIVNQLKLQQIRQQIAGTQQKLDMAPDKQLAAQVASVESILGRKLTDSEKASLLGIGPAKTAEPKTSWRVQPGPDSKPHDVLYDDVTGAPIRDAGLHFEPEKTTPQPRTAWKVDTINGQPHDVLYDDKGNVVKVGGLHYERPEKGTALSPAQLAAQFNQTLNVFKMQLTQSQTALNQASSQKTQHPIYSGMGILGTDPKSAAAVRDRAQKAISYLLSQKQKVLAGQADPQDVSDKAQQILDGSSDASGAPAVGTIEGGFRFLGGDPADQKNWQKVSGNGR